MLQRAIDSTDPASGDWEFPGGHAEGTESPYETACREWCEETGAPLPDGQCVGNWLSPDGVYELFVYEVPDETCIPINPDTPAVLNPDDPDGDNIETVAWLDLSDLPGNPMLRSECLLVPFQDVAQMSA